LQDFGTHHAETLQFLHTKINNNRMEKCDFIQFLTGDLLSAFGHSGPLSSEIRAL
jgi:hypothetical protein